MGANESIPSAEAKVVVSFSNGVQLVQLGEPDPVAPIDPAESRHVLDKKLGGALKHPGISRTAVPTRSK